MTRAGAFARRGCRSSVLPAWETAFGDRGGSRDEGDLFPCLSLPVAVDREEVSSGGAGPFGIARILLLGPPGGLPGLDFQASCSALGLGALFARPLQLSTNKLYHLVRGTSDTTRYFEFGFAWKHIAARATLGAYLDISSPRVLPLILLRRKPAESAVLLNPDVSDLCETRRIFRACGMEARCATVGDTVEGSRFPDGAFDVITSISVVEHIRDKSEAVGKIWRLLKPGGLLILSLPCAAEATEEFRDVDSYGLQRGGKDWYFFQTLYDSALLAERIFGVLGQPKDMAIYGERVAGSYRENLQRKLRDPAYPHWKEPYLTGRQWRRYGAIDDLPGEGVVALAFEKERAGPGPPPCPSTSAQRPYEVCMDRDPRAHVGSWQNPRS